MLRSWGYKIFISLAAATVLLLYSAYPHPTRTHHKAADAQTPATSATSSPAPHIPDSHQLGHPDLATPGICDRYQPRPGHHNGNQ